jgi:hypothetical protein
MSDISRMDSSLFERCFPVYDNAVFLPCGETVRESLLNPRRPGGSHSRHS